MLPFLQQPLFAFSLTLVVSTAVLVYLYGKITEREGEAPRKAMFKTLAAGLLAAMVLAYLAGRGGTANTTPAVQPFDAVPGGIEIGI